MDALSVQLKTTPARLRTGLIGLTVTEHDQAARWRSLPNRSGWPTGETASFWAAFSPVASGAL